MSSYHILEGPLAEYILHKSLVLGLSMVSMGMCLK